MSSKAKDMFGNFYQIGRKGDMAAFNAFVLETRNPLVSELRENMLDGRLALDKEVHTEIWVEGDEKIPPTPWKPNVLLNYRFNVNTATVVDFLAMKDISVDLAEKLVEERDRRRGFVSAGEFTEIKASINSC